MQRAGAPSRCPSSRDVVSEPLRVAALAAFSLGAIYDDGAPRVARDAANRVMVSPGSAAVLASDWYWLGRLYVDGRGVPRDVGQAIEWLRRAADQGDADAQIELGLPLTPGRSAEADIVEAHMWLTWRRRDGRMTKRIRSASLRDDLENAMTPDQRSAARPRDRVAGCAQLAAGGDGSDACNIPVARPSR